MTTCRRDAVHLGLSSCAQSQDPRWRETRPRDAVHVGLSSCAQSQDPPLPTCTEQGRRRRAAHIVSRLGRSAPGRASVSIPEALAGVDPATARRMTVQWQAASRSQCRLPGWREDLSPGRRPLWPVILRAVAGSTPAKLHRTGTSASRGAHRVTDRPVGAWAGQRLHSGGLGGGGSCDCAQDDSSWSRRPGRSATCHGGSCDCAQDDTWLASFNRTVAQSHSRTFARPHGRTAAQPHSRTAAQPHNRTTAQPHSRSAVPPPARHPASSAVSPQPATAPASSPAYSRTTPGKPG